MDASYLVGLLLAVAVVLVAVDIAEALELAENAPPVAVAAD